MAPKGFPWEKQQEDITQASNIQSLKRMHLFTLLGFVLQNTEYLSILCLMGGIRVLIHQLQAKQANSHFRKASFLLLSALLSPFLQLVTHGQVERARQNQTAVCMSARYPACSDQIQAQDAPLDQEFHSCVTTHFFVLLFSMHFSCLFLQGLFISTELFLPILHPLPMLFYLLPMFFPFLSVTGN